MPPPPSRRRSRRRGRPCASRVRRRRHMLGFLIDVLFGTGAHALGRGIGRGLASASKSQAPPPPAAAASSVAPPPEDKARSLAGSALVFSLLGLCRAPFPLLALFLARRAAGAARAQGRSIPGSAVFALLLSFAGLAFSAAFLVFGLHTRHQYQEHVAAVRA